MIVIGSAVAWPAASRAADPAADAKQADDAREKVWNSPEMLHARAWLESYFSVSRKYTPEKAAEYRLALSKMSAPEMELWLMKFEHDRALSRSQEAAWEQQRRIEVSRDEAALAQARQALNNVNRGNNQAAAAAQKVITQQGQEAERNFQQNAAEQSQFINNEYNRPYVPYYYYGR